MAISLMQMRKMGKKVHFLLPPFYQAVCSAFLAPLFMFFMLYYREATTAYGWYEFWMIGALTLCWFVS